MNRYYVGRRDEFLRIFKKAEDKYSKSTKRLAGEGWNKDWKTLIVTIMSAQSRDETTISVAEELFSKYKTLEKLAKAKYKGVLEIFKSLNYNRTKAKHVIKAARMLLNDFNRKTPDSLEKLLRIPGVGRKTANLVLSEVHNKNSITIDTHCHRILNLLGVVKTKNPYQTELEMKKIAPRKYWSKINRILVLWGKDVKGRDRKKLLKKLGES